MAPESAAGGDGPREAVPLAPGRVGSDITADLPAGPGVAEREGGFDGAAAPGGSCAPLPATEEYPCNFLLFLVTELLGFTLRLLVCTFVDCIGFTVRGFTMRSRIVSLCGSSVRNFLASLE